jgi:hypothetical protein
MGTQKSGLRLRQTAFIVTSAFLVIALIPALNGCGGGSSPGMTGTPPSTTPTAKTVVQVNMGD